MEKSIKIAGWIGAMAAMVVCACFGWIIGATDC